MVILLASIRQPKERPNQRRGPMIGNAVTEAEWTQYDPKFWIAGSVHDGGIIEPTAISIDSPPRCRGGGAVGNGGEGCC
jgi:hypothetical protein